MLRLGMTDSKPFTNFDEYAKKAYGKPLNELMLQGNLSIQKKI